MDQNKRWTARNLKELNFKEKLSQSWIIYKIKLSDVFLVKRNVLFGQKMNWAKNANEQMTICSFLFLLSRDCQTGRGSYIVGSLSVPAVVLGWGPKWGLGQVVRQMLDFLSTLSLGIITLNLSSITRYHPVKIHFFCRPSGFSPCGWTDWAVILPTTLGVALLCSSWAGSDMWLYPELIVFLLLSNQYPNPEWGFKPGT